MGNLLPMLTVPDQSEANVNERIELSSPYCTLWQYCLDTILIGYHFLYRKSDHALSCDDTFSGTIFHPPLIFDAPETK